MTNEQIIILCEKYDDMLGVMGHKCKKNSINVNLGHLRWMLSEIKTFVNEDKLDKANRWVGFIQGVLWSKDILSIDAMKVYNKNEDVEVKPYSELSIPTNLDEAFSYLDNWAGGKEKFLAANENSALFGAHHSLGQHIRNEWELWSALGDHWDEPTPLVKWFMDTHKIKHADDISSIIILSYHRHKNNKPLDIESQLKKYHDHWKKHDPKMLEM